MTVYQPPDDVKATGVEIIILADDKKLGVAAQLSNGQWEVHPIDDDLPWTYSDCADMAVQGLVEFYKSDMRESQRLTEEWRKNRRAAE
jgi:hypothetical protein